MPCLLPSPSKLPVLSSPLKFLPHPFELLLNLPPSLPPALPPVWLFPILYYLVTSYSYLLLHLVKYILLRGYTCYTVISHTLLFRIPLYLYSLLLLSGSPGSRCCSRQCSAAHLALCTGTGGCSGPEETDACSDCGSQR